MSDTTKIHQLLAAMKTLGASDLHLKAGAPPIYRVGGHLRATNMPPMSGEEIEQCMSVIIPQKRRVVYDETGDLDFSTTLPDDERFRVNVFRAGAVMNAAVRRVNPTIPSYAELNLPAIYEDLITKSHEGIIIITGVTGSGKSTTLAAMIEQINSTHAKNIITIEDPIEYLFKSKKSVISQREIGIDIPDYSEGLKYMVRQDPDVIFIGEMRDQFTMMAALQAAETGHLVFGTLHTADAMQAFTRILEFFPKGEHKFVRSSLSNTLKAICAQRLLPGIEEGEMVPATEILINSPTARELIRKGQDQDIPALIESSEKEGMHSFTTALAELVEQEKVFMDVAMQFAPNREALASRLRGIKTAAKSMIQRTS